MVSCSESEFNTSRIPSLHKRYLFVPTTSMSFDAQPSTQRIDVESEQTDWILNIPVDWVKADQMSGNSSASLEISTLLNNSADTSRVCVASISSNVSDWNRSFPITITQEKNSPYITCSDNSIVFSAVKQSSSITVSTNAEYTVENTGSSWLHIDSFSPNEVRFSVDENNTGTERNAILTLKAKSYPGTSISITVRQKIANITTTKEKLYFGHNGSSQQVDIESEASWTATSTSWVSVSPTSGNAGKTNVTISVPNNASVNSRSGSVYFNIAGNNNIEVPIMQEGVTLNVSQTNIAFTSFGGSQYLSVDSNDKWTIKEKPDWVYVDKNSAEGNATVQISTEENNTTKEKNGNIIIATDDGVTSKTIHVKQGAKTVDYGDASLVYGYAASTQTISFTTDGNWSLTKDADWITVDRTSGSGSSVLKISVAENTTLDKRNGRIVLNIAGEVFTITVFQECKYLNISSDAFHFTSQVGYTNVSITSNTNWNARAKDKPNWLIVTPSSGSKNADITIGVSENNTPDQRIGVVEVEIPNIRTYLINITQDGKYIKTDKSSVEFTSSGGSIVLNVTTDGTFEVSKSGNWFGYTRNENTITIVAPSNNTGAERTGSINFILTNLSSGAYTLKVNVKQKK